MTESFTAKIITEAKERADEFIFSTIYPFCSEAAEMHISKKELADALMLWKKLVRCENCKYHDTVSLNCEFLAATTLDQWYCGTENGGQTMKPCKNCNEFSCGANGSDYVSMKCGSEEGFIRVTADCFSLPNAAELVKNLRDYSAIADDIRYAVLAKQAADAIEQLIAENAKLKEERDAAVADISHFCDKCKHLNDAYCVGCKWEWRGVQE